MSVTLLLGGLPVYPSGRLAKETFDYVEHVFDDREMLDVAIRRPDGTTAVDLGHRGTPPLPVSAAFDAILPEGLGRGSTVSVTGSVSLLLALLGAASTEGAWCALVGFPLISAEAAYEYGIELSRLALVPDTGSGWTTAVGALLDAVDVVAARPPVRGDLPPGDVRRLAARARTRDAVFVPFLVGTAPWPGADIRLTARHEHWSGIGAGTGRLRARRVEVRAEGRGSAARARSASLWLPAAGGGVEAVDRVDTGRPSATLTPVIDLAG
ncbi:MAG: hypothetical protein M3N95_00930 [Actinomycetota bacterium]|nr:hypothetical protein [Actinomycetota bacterium]